MGESLMMPWEEAQQSDSAPWEEAQQSQPDQKKSLLNQVSDMGMDAIGHSPLGMVSQGANTIQQGLGKVSNAFSLPVPQAVQQGAQSLFKGTRALGVGVARNLTGETPEESTQGVLDTLQDNPPSKNIFQNAIDKTGSFLGENAPVALATAASPLAGAAALTAQQAQSGKVSPVPLALGAVSGALGKSGELTNKIGSTMENVGQKMANSIAGVLPNTIRRLANTFSETGNPSDAGAAIGQKLVNDGILEGDDAGGMFDRVQSKVNESGQAVGKSLKAIHDEANKYGAVENPLQLDSKTILQPLEEQASKLSAGRLSGTRAMGTPVNQMLKSLQQTSEQNNGFLNFDDIEEARKEAGQLLAKTPQQSPKFSQYSQLYGTLADMRNNAVNQIAENASNPQLATDLQKANSEFHFYDSVLSDVSKNAAQEGAGRGGLASGISSKMGMLGAIYALARGDVERAVALGVGGKVLPFVENAMENPVSKELIKTGSFLKNKGATIQSVPKVGMGLLNTSNMAPKVLDEQTARDFLEKAGGDKSSAREMAKAAGYTF